MATHNEERFFEDLEIGQKFHSGTEEITAERIKSFAAEFDPQPFHLDEDAARASLFRGLAASGWHTAAVTMRLLVDSDLRPAGGPSGRVGRTCAGHSRFDRGTCCTSRPRWWRSARRARGPSSGSSRSA